MITFRITKRKPGRQKGAFQVEIVGGNGERMFVSEGYVKRSGAFQAAKTVVSSCANADWEVDDRTRSQTNSKARKRST